MTPQRQACPTCRKTVRITPAGNYRKHGKCKSGGRRARQPLPEPQASLEKISEEPTIPEGRSFIRGVGRPSKITDELLEKLCGYLKDGNYIETSCALVGISKNTFYERIRNGERDLDTGKWTRDSQIADAVQGAMATSEHNTLQKISGHWMAHAWRQERRHPTKWGQRTTLYSGDAPPAGEMDQVDATIKDTLARMAASGEPEPEDDDG